MRHLFSPTTFLSRMAAFGLALQLTPALAFAVSVDPATPPSSATVIPIPPGQIEAAVAKLDELAAEIMERSGIPGMAVAVVKDGETVYAEGFGVRKAGEGAAVDADTVFQLASVSKSIGATVVARQVSAGVIAWNTPVSVYLPWLALSDEWVTEHVTVGDLYAHRSGLQDHVGDQLEDLGYDRREILERLRFAPLGPFRDQYAYTNFGMTLGAEAVAAAAQIDWETLSEEALYEPLGMGSTSSRFDDFLARENRASGHALVNGTYTAAYRRQPDAQSPAGGVSSSVNDLAKWMAMILQDGDLDGEVFIAEEALLPALSPQIVSAPPRSPSERASFYGHGFNVAVAPSGRTTLSHSGAFLLGAGTSFTMIPSADVGIVVLTNAAPAGAAEAVAAAFADLVQFGEVTRDWYAAYSGLMSGLYTPFGSLVGQNPPANAAPAAERGAYVGVFANNFYGEATIEETDAGLAMRLGPGGMSFPLKHWDADVFTFELFSENASQGSVSTIAFKPSAEGYGELQIEYFSEDIDNGVFARR
ncbi:serine hydrolase [Mesorhizobium sp. A623]